MSVKEKFDEIIGLPFELEDNSYPEYVITLGPSHFMALVDLLKFPKELDWQPFVIKSLPDKGHVYFDNECFNVILIKKAIEVMKPNEYNVYKEYNRETKGNNYVLALKNGNYAILISSAIPKEEEVKKKLEDYVKEPPKSVFIL